MNGSDLREEASSIAFQRLILVKIREISRNTDEVNIPEDVDFSRIILFILAVVLCSEVLQPLALQVTHAVGMRCGGACTLRHPWDPLAAVAGL